MTNKLLDELGYKGGPGSGRKPKGESNKQDKPSFVNTPEQYAKQKQADRESYMDTGDSMFASSHQPDNKTDEQKSKENVEKARQDTENAISNYNKNFKTYGKNHNRTKVSEDAMNQAYAKWSDLFDAHHKNFPQVANLTFNKNKF